MKLHTVLHRDKIFLANDPNKETIEANASSTES